MVGPRLDLLERARADALNLQRVMESSLIDDEEHRAAFLAEHGVGPLALERMERDAEALAVPGEAGAAYRSHLALISRVKAALDS